MSGWDKFTETFFNPTVMAKYLPDIIDGFFLTIRLALLVIIAGIALGLFLAVVRAFAIRPLNWLIIFVVDLFRALPPLVIIVLIYFGLPSAGISPDAFVATWISLTLVLMAFTEEIFWAGITSVPRGQWEAARSTGLSRLQAMTYVILPQAVRNVLPDLVSNTLEVVKLTSIASVVALPELLFQARQAQSVTYNPTPIVVAAIAYFVLLWPLVRLVSRLENSAIAGRR